MDTWHDANHPCLDATDLKEHRTMKKLTFDDLANIYDKVTGGTARIKPIDSVLEWAERKKE